MTLVFGKNSEKFYVAIDSNPIQHRRSSYLWGFTDYINGYITPIY